MTEPTFFDDGNGYCDVCGLELREGRCTECDRLPTGQLTAQQIADYGRIDRRRTRHDPLYDWRSGWRFALVAAVPLILMVAAPTVAVAVGIGLIALVLGLVVLVLHPAAHRTKQRSNQ